MKLVLVRILKNLNNAKLFTLLDVFILNFDNELNIIYFI
jgi:hypothetical protein